MTRHPVGRIKLQGSRGWRTLPFVMGGTVRMRKDEWVEFVSITRPVEISEAGSPVAILASAPQLWMPGPWALAGPRTLRFNRLARVREAGQ